MRLMRVLAFLLLGVILASPFVLANPAEDADISEPTWDICTISGEVILTTSIEVRVGDQFLNEDNTLYTIVSVDGQRAIAEWTEQLDLRSFLIPNVSVSEFVAIPAQARQGKVGIYHTHGWESYRPSDGTSQRVGRGGIFDVGDSMASGFQDRGVTVERSTNQERNYSTSRRTALDLLKAGCSVIIDIHRDTAPASAYTYEIDGKTATKALMVVGRQNPNTAVNKELAYRVKSVTDSSYPGLIRGVYLAHGNYNQDLSPRAMLIEFGSATNLKEAASRTAYALAGVIAELLFPPVPAAEPDAEPVPENIPQPAPIAPDAPERRALWQSYLAWGAMLSTMVGGFILINEPSWDAVRRRVKQFTEEEFGDLIGRVKRK